MALALSDLETWLTGQLSTVPVGIDWMPLEPDEIVVVSDGGGTGTMLDGAFEGTHVHVRCRATSDATAEALAVQIHHLLAASGSFHMGGTYVMACESASGPPAFLVRDEAQRSTYYATYLFTCPTA